MLEDFQSAYKCHHSTETVLVRVHNDILKAVDDNKSVILLLLDLLAAFDTVDHTILLLRLANRLGVRDTAPNWFLSYLQSHKQFVSVNGIESSMKNLQYGLPQGSCWVLYCVRFTEVNWVILPGSIAYHFICIQMMHSCICCLRLTQCPKPFIELEEDS